MPLQCKMCGSGMPDDAQKCGVCSAPVNEEAQQAAPTAPSIVAGIPGLPNQPQQPAANYLSPNMGAQTGGDVRVSLTGDVIEVAQPTQRGSGPGGYGAPPAGKGGAPAGGPARPRYGLPAAAQEGRGGAGLPVGMIVIVLVILIGGGGFGFWWWQKQQAPKKAAEKFGTALVAKNWGDLYDATYLSPEIEGQLKTVMNGAKDGKQAFTMALTLAAANTQYKDMSVGSASITNDSANVGFTITQVTNGQSKTDTIDMPMKLVEGNWKVDLVGFQQKAVMKTLGSGGGGAAGGGFGGASPAGMSGGIK